MKSSFRLSLLLAAGALALAACGGEEATPALGLVASTPGSIGTGEQRVLLALVDPETQAFLAAPDREATATFTGPGEQTIEVPLDFVWSLENHRGLYRAMVDLPEEGNWTVTIAAEGLDATPPTAFFAATDTAMPQVGNTGPAVATPVAADHELSEITTDPEPDPGFYRLSLEEALTNGRPSVIVFATPAFCTTQTCGPVLDNVKEIAPAHPEVDFVHVEVYENLDAERFEDLVLVEAVEKWALPSEPWVFVTAADGTIAARFEGTIDRSELELALTQVGG